MANDSTQKASFNWLMKMAWRDSRRSRSRLFLFTTSIVLGVAALVAISGFGDNLRRDINNQAKELLGADLVLYTNRVVPDSVQQFLDSLGGVQSRENAFSSMVSFPKSGGTRPVQVRAMEGGFPFYGQFETVPEAAGMEFMNGRKALVDQTLMFQFNAKVGDSIKVGESYFEIAGKLLRVPGENSVFGAIYAPVYIPMAYLDETKLVQKGSRVTFKRYYQFAEEKDVDGMVEGLETRMRDMRLRANTVAERKRNLGAAFADMTRFLNLVAFIALLLGCLGVASAVSIYIREKIPSVAILRCLGASGRQTYWIYLIQIIGMGVVGSLVGAIIGSLVQQIVPWVLGEFIPIQTSMQLSASAILKGIGVGITIAVLFALLPLLSIRRISPLFALRASFEKGMSRFDLSRLAVVGLITLFVLAFAFWQTERLLEASMFTLAVAVGFLALAGVAQGLTWLVRRFFPKQLGYIWRQSLANLYRPQNQTLVLMTSIGLGTALIATLFYVQGTLVQEIELTDQGDRPNMVIFDIKPDEVAQVQELCNEFAFETDQDVPIVNMRLASLKGVSRRELLRDTTNTIRTGSINREYR
ncbi:MAG: FtsX-like permease family protein, partial [Bacteroidota bacterium]